MRAPGFATTNWREWSTACVIAGFVVALLVVGACLYEIAYVVPPGQQPPEPDWFRLRVVCGGAGAIIAGIAAIGTNVVLPGLGLVVAGPLAAALAGAGAGGLTGGLVGALIGSGIPEDRAKLYDEGIRNGGMVMGVNPRNPEDAEYFENEWKNYNGQHIYR